MARALASKWERLPLPWSFIQLASTDEEVTLETEVYEADLIKNSTIVGPALDVFPHKTPKDVVFKEAIIIWAQSTFSGEEFLQRRNNSWMDVQGWLLWKLCALIRRMTVRNKGAKNAIIAGLKEKIKVAPKRKRKPSDAAEETDAGEEEPGEEGEEDNDGMDVDGPGQETVDTVTPDHEIPLDVEGPPKIGPIRRGNSVTPSTGPPTPRLGTSAASRSASKTSGSGDDGEGKNIKETSHVDDLLGKMAKLAFPTESGPISLSDEEREETMTRKTCGKAASEAVGPKPPAGFEGLLELSKAGLLGAPSLNPKIKSQWALAKAKAKGKAAPKAKGKAAPKAKGKAAPKAKGKAAPKAQGKAQPKMAAAKKAGKPEPKATATAHVKSKSTQGGHGKNPQEGAPPAPAAKQQDAVEMPGPPGPWDTYKYTPGTLRSLQSEFCRAHAVFYEDRGLSVQDAIAEAKRAWEKRKAAFLSGMDEKELKRRRFI